MNLSDFPDEIIFEILRYSRPKDLPQVLSVCRRFNRLQLNATAEVFKNVNESTLSKVLRRAVSHRDFYCQPYSLTLIKNIITVGAPINKRDGWGRTPLYLAVERIDMRKSTDIVELLLSAGARVDYKDRQGLTPLHIAAFAPNAKALDLMIESHEKRFNNTKCVEYKDSMGATPLHYAAEANCAQCMFLLVAKKASLDAQDYYGRGIIDYTDKDSDFYDLIRPLVVA